MAALVCHKLHHVVCSMVLLRFVELECCPVPGHAKHDAISCAVQRDHSGCGLLVCSEIIEVLKMVGVRCCISCYSSSHMTCQFICGSTAITACVTSWFKPNAVTCQLAAVEVSPKLSLGDSVRAWYTAYNAAVFLSNHPPMVLRTVIPVCFCRRPAACSLSSTLYWASNTTTLHSETSSTTFSLCTCACCTACLGWSACRFMSQLVTSQPVLGT